MLSQFTIELEPKLDVRDVRDLFFRQEVPDRRRCVKALGNGPAEVVLARVLDAGLASHVQGSAVNPQRDSWLSKEAHSSCDYQR